MRSVSAVCQAVALVASIGMFAGNGGTLAAEPLQVKLRSQQETKPGSDRYHTQYRDESWRPEQTAIIVCDVWDLHHCLNAVKRETEFAPRLNEVLTKLRSQGVTIIHAPSDCMASYETHPARKRAMNTPLSAKLPGDIKSWCSKIPAEEKGKYPIDQSDGGEDDDPAEHAAWAKELAAKGRNPKLPWKSQSDLITIDGEKDYITDKGDEVWSILEARGIDNVILAGVHTNMCVLGRPFGLRQMSKNGKNVALLRDMTDTMYNPARWPYVSHFTGTDLIISHVERFVAPTLTSDQFIGGQPFRYAGDKRPHVVVVMSEAEYETARTLPEYAGNYLGKDFRVSYVYGQADDESVLVGVEAVKSADVLVLSMRRRTLPAEQLQVFKEYVQAGKPVVAIRTSSHAFVLRDGTVPVGRGVWPEFDAEVLGGHYAGHHGNDLKGTGIPIAAKKDHPILSGIPAGEFPLGGSLYQVSPLASGAVPLVMGRIEGQPEEPIAWTFERADKGRTFYTSLGHKADFESSAVFARLLANGIYWAAGKTPREDLGPPATTAKNSGHWTPVVWDDQRPPRLIGNSTWLRCVVHLPADWQRPIDTKDAVAVCKVISPDVRLYWNGREIPSQRNGSISLFTLTPIDWEDVNLCVLNGRVTGLVPEIYLAGQTFPPVLLKGTWQQHAGDDSAFASLPLPPKFALPTDVVFDFKSLSK